MGVNFQNAPFIMGEILQFRRFPSDLFFGSPEKVDEVRNLIAGY